MNRRGFLRGMLGAAAAVVVSASAPRLLARTDDIDFLRGEMIKGVHKLPLMVEENALPMLPCHIWHGAGTVLDNFGISSDSVKLALVHTETGERVLFDEPAWKLLDGDHGWHSVDSRAAMEWEDIGDPDVELAELEPPRVGRVWYVGPHGDDANDGLTPDTALLTSQAVAAACSPGDPQSVVVYLGEPTKEL